MWSEVYRDTFAFEQHHWWFLAQRRLAEWAADSLTPRRSPHGARRLLDIGVGGGATLIALARHGEAVGLDYSEEALGYAGRRPGISILCRGTADALPFQPRTFDVVTILNVLCHKAVNDDRAVIRQVFEVLRPGGILLITDPAYNCIRRHHDIVEMVARRYTAGRIARNTRQAGFTVERAGYMYSFLLPAILWQVVMDRLFRHHQRPTSDLSPPPRWLNAILDGTCRLELRLLRQFPLPFGSTAFCIARRPE